MGILLVAFLLLAAADAIRLRGVVADLQRGNQLARQSAQVLGQPQEWDGERIARAAELNKQALAVIGPANSRIHAEPSLGVLGSLPRINDQTRTMQDLADALLNSARAETDLIDLAQLYVKQHGATGPIGPRLLAVLAASAPLVADADRLLQPSLQILRHDLTRPLANPVRNEVAAAVKALGPVADNVATLQAMSTSLPAAIGASGARRYLVLLQNPSEIRPAGGLTGYLGPITLVNGEPTDLTIKGVGVFNPLFKECFPIPKPLVYYMTFYKNCFELGDAGWSADFPTTSRLMEQMYASATGEKVDGVIAIDPYAMAQILKLVGAVNDPTYGEFNADNFYTKTNILTNVRLDPRFIQPVGNLIVSKLTSLPLASWPALAAALTEQSRGRHVQLYMHDPQLSKPIAQARFDGSVLPNGQDDYLMVVDANMHANKADFFITRTADVKVEIYPSGINRHQVILHYDYLNGPPNDHDDKVLNGDGKYIGYVRIYLPDTANIGSIDYKVDGKKMLLSLGEVTHEFGKTVVGVTFILDRGHAGDISFLYSDALNPGSKYALFVQKQAGIPGRLTKLEVSYPGGIARRQAPLATDQTFEVQW